MKNTTSTGLPGLRNRSIGWKLRSSAFLALFTLVALGAWFTEFNPGADQGFTMDRPPHSFLLSWQQDPTSTMTIDWHTAKGFQPVLQYRRQGARTWTLAKGETIPFPYSDMEIHRVELTGLRADMMYEFRLGPVLEVFRFRTMPASITDRPILFATGGDMMHSQHTFRAVNLQAIKHDLDFFAVGGDLAYADAKPENLHRWLQYLKVWSETMIHDNNRVIPHIAGIGNHEVKRYYVHNYHHTPQRFDNTHEWRMREAPYFYSLMAFPGEPGYGTLDFGNYLSLVFLDTQHTNPIAGEQTRWLELALANRADFNHVVPIYHVPAWPSVRDPNNNETTLVRRHFLPQFERYSNIRVAFENHDHAYKRTKPIRSGMVSPTGIVYVGDGAYGVGVRPLGAQVGTEEGWYLDNAASIRHFILVEVAEDELDLRMIDENGVQFDSLRVNGDRRFAISSVDANQAPDRFYLEQNFPNPFNTGTSIRYSVAERGRVTIEVFNMQGQRVSSLVDREMQSGWHTVNFDGSRLSSGTYMLRMRANGDVFTRKMMLVK